MFKSWFASAGRLIRRARFRGTKPIPLLGDLCGGVPEKVIVRCKYGRAWITHRSDPEDHVLGQGEFLTVSLNRHPVISLSEHALVEFSVGTGATKNAGLMKRAGRERLKAR